jgi:acetyl esterase/lipase
MPDMLRRRQITPRRAAASFDPSAMTLDPAAKRFLDMVGAASASEIAQLSPAEMRERFRRLMRLVGPKSAPIALIEDGELPGVAGPIPFRVYTPCGSVDPCSPGLIYFHGGGGVFGSIETHDGLCGMLANASGCRVISIGYRLAPEHQFPAAVEDSYAAVSWVFANASTLGVDPLRIGVAGDSAGGGLAATVCQRASRDGGPKISLQVLLCPVLDLAGESESRRALANGYFLDKATLDWMIKQYCPPDVALTDPRLSPLHATDLSGQPPTHVHTAEFDPLRSEGHAYADRLQRAGVDVRYTCHAGMIHHFYGMAGIIPYAHVAMNALGGDIREALAHKADAAAMAAVY